MRRVLLLACLTVALADAVNWRVIRRIAQAGACADSMIDARTTLRPGQRESNPILGQGGQVVGVKIGMCVGQIVAAELYLRRHPQHEQAVTTASFGTAAMYSAIAARNARLK
jgi:hypothetical protein